LRFAQNSQSTTVHNLDQPIPRKRSLAERRGLRNPLEPSRQNSPTGSPSRRLRKASHSASVSTLEASWFLALPEKIRKKQFTQEEQVRLAGRQRESVILDAADEAIYKASRRASRNLAPLTPKQQPSTPSKQSMESTRSAKERPTSIALAMAESFRWMDEEPDLRLVLDDYHANLDGAVLPSSSSSLRPSFRRNMSITKIPFGRASLASSTKSPTSPSGTLPALHSRQRSRALSLMSPKQAEAELRISIDPHATHYQDPEARLKLRVYLASPQKFDEAIEFGFPSLEGVSGGVDKENIAPRKVSRDQALRKTGLSDGSHTFFNDDSGSLLEDDVSMMDPDSPLTPCEVDTTFKSSNQSRLIPLPESGNYNDFTHLGIKKPTIHRHTDSYSQSAAGSREMTLRMTLTRPDLRADEDMIYGWQSSSSRARSPLTEEPIASEASVDEKFEMKGPFGGPDGWGPQEKDDGVVRRIWNRVRSSQRKVSSNSSRIAT
jgi:hypothetical protein